MSNPFLEHLAWQFAKPEGKIFEDQNAKVVEFWPAGYSQSFLSPCKNIPGAAEKINRQEFYAQLYKEAEDLGTESNLFPFANVKYKILFVPEPHNKYDPCALKIEISTPDNGYWNDYSVGYVPAKINQLVIANKERISDKRILTVTNNLNDKFYCARIALGYDGTILNDIEDKSLERFKWI